MKKIITQLKIRTNKLKKKLVILHYALEDKDTPWYVKALIFLIIAYAVSPIDLIPDFIPIIGYLDDLILLPLGIMLAIKLIPRSVLSRASKRASSFKQTKKQKRAGVILIILLWLIICFVIFKALFHKYL